MAEIKYVKLANEEVIEATQVSYNIQPSGQMQQEQLLLQIDTNSFENQANTLYKKLTNDAIKDVNVYADKDCKMLIFAAGPYQNVNSVSASVRMNGLLYSVSLLK